ncbi:4Fe-4S single cluster domain-containing protein [Providencia manganoxydans]|uniref:4Fe-4S single cluster domain-containing protein n=1 Tax=Providencia manganoxydans TaxID=2923283 RepID=UPI0034E5879B
MTKISLSRVHFPVTTLGPGQRIGLWVQGCSIHCKGCMSPDTWHRRESGIDIMVLMQQLKPWLQEADGITISGGEPFEQRDALQCLLTELRQDFQGDILVYSGYEWDDIHQDILDMNGLIDALITGPYQESAPQTLALRGSDNQQLHCLTSLGKQRFSQYDTQLIDSHKALDLAVDETGRIFLLGIPQRHDMSYLQSWLEQQEQPLKQLKK